MADDVPKDYSERPCGSCGEFVDTTTMSFAFIRGLGALRLCPPCGELARSGQPIRRADALNPRVLEQEGSRTAILKRRDREAVPA